MRNFLELNLEDSKSSQTSGIDAMETCDLGIPCLGLGLGIRSRVRVRARVKNQVEGKALG